MSWGLCRGCSTPEVRPAPSRVRLVPARDTAFMSLTLLVSLITGSSLCSDVSGPSSVTLVRVCAFGPAGGGASQRRREVSGPAGAGRHSMRSCRAPRAPCPVREPRAPAQARSRHQRPPRPRAASPHPRTQAITPPALHAAPRCSRRHSVHQPPGAPTAPARL